MTYTSEPEVWLRGPIAGIPPMLQPVAHSLLQCRDEVRATVGALPPRLLSVRPNGAAAAGFHDAVERALSQLRSTPESILQHRREVGRARLPSTVVGLLFHAAEHTQRHVGQLVTTAKVVSE